MDNFSKNAAMRSSALRLPIKSSISWSRTLSWLRIRLRLCYSEEKTGESSDAPVFFWPLRLNRHVYQSSNVSSNPWSRVYLKCRCDNAVVLRMLERCLSYYNQFERIANGQRFLIDRGRMYQNTDRSYLELYLPWKFLMSCYAKSVFPEQTGLHLSSDESEQPCLRALRPGVCAGMENAFQRSDPP